MKKLLIGLATFFNFIIAFAISLLVLAVSFEPSIWESVKRILIEQIFPVIGWVRLQCFFAIIVILQLYYLYIRSKKVPRTKYIAFGNPDGEVLLTVSAIEDFIGKVAKTFKEIHHMDARVTPVKDGIYIHLNAVLSSGNNLPTVTEDIQRNIKYQIQNILGIENVQGIEMQIVEILEMKDNKAEANLENEVS